MSEEDASAEPVRTTVELVGEYEDIAEILGDQGDSPDYLDPVVDDLAAILDIVRQTDGATKSQIAEEASERVSVGLDPDSVIHALRLLALYEFVALDGNTWRPGPALATE
ncbi:MAG: hypothetical protein ABEJ26_10210 [Halosimplex sp.]